MVVQYASTHDVAKLFRRLENPWCVKKISAYERTYIQRHKLSEGEMQRYLSMTARCSKVPFDSDDIIIHASKTYLVHPSKCGRVDSPTTHAGIATPGPTSLFEAAACGLWLTGHLGTTVTKKEHAKNLRIKVAEFVIDSPRSSQYVKKASDKYRSQFVEGGGRFSLHMYASKMRDGTSFSSGPEAWALANVEDMSVHIYERRGTTYERVETYWSDTRGHCCDNPKFVRLLRVSDGVYYIIMKNWEERKVSGENRSSKNTAKNILRGGTPLLATMAKPNTNAKALLRKNSNHRWANEGRNSDTSPTAPPIPANYVSNLLSRISLTNRRR